MDWMIPAKNDVSKIFSQWKILYKQSHTNGIYRKYDITLKTKCNGL